MITMIKVSENLTFSLTNNIFSYVFRVSPEGLIEHLYYGGPLQNPEQVSIHHLRTQRETSSVFEGHQHLNLSGLPQEFPSFGTSDYRFPALHGRNSDGNTIFSLQYKKHKIVKEKPRLKKLPSARGGDSETLVITLEDTLHKLEVELFYTIYIDYGVLVRSAKFKNKSDVEIQLQHAFSSALDLPPSEYEILHLHGTWAREFNEERIDMPKGRFVIDSARGTSSAAHNPFIADRAVQVGVDMLVLDDGWFEGRRDDTSSLGDWRADKIRFPSGIPALAAKVKAKGLKFGIWFEPEMVNPNSQLFKDHPDWAIQVPGRKLSLGRNQLTLMCFLKIVRAAGTVLISACSVTCLKAGSAICVIQ